MLHIVAWVSHCLVSLLVMATKQQNGFRNEKEEEWTRNRKQRTKSRCMIEGDQREKVDTQGMRVQSKQPALLSSILQVRSAATASGHQKQEPSENWEATEGECFAMQNLQILLENGTITTQEIKNQRAKKTKNRCHRFTLAFADRIYTRPQQQRQQQRW